MRRRLAVFVFVASVLPASSAVRVWQGTLTLPVYEEGAPDPNPPFDQFAARLNYPYTLRNSLTGGRAPVDWRALFLENEFLKCSVLPDLGGHLYSCTDKLNGQEMFYANGSIKKALISYRGAWAAFGVEFNFPVSHSWVSLSPVDFATRQNPDGSATVTVGNIDRPYGMEWQVELTLRPGSTVLEQRVTLYNRADVRHRYYWWTNAGVRVEDESKIEYPMRYTASHGFTYVDKWPVGRDGLDLSIIRNHKTGSVSQFVHGSREPFMGVWHPKAASGVAHYAEYGDLPGKKIWSWGVDASGLEWRKTLSDDNSGYVEVQAGPFRNQETYAFLEPQETSRWTEYWMPVRAIGGISRANLHGVVHVARNGGAFEFAMNVNHAVPGARVRVTDAGKPVFETRADATPAATIQRTIENAPKGKLTVELADGAGAVLLSHTEDTYDWTPEAEIRPGPQEPVRLGKGTLELGQDHELNGRLLEAWDTYREALAASPESLEANRAAGRLAVTLLRYEEGAALLRKALYRISNDPETQYYLGIAEAALGHTRDARAAWEGAQRQPQFRAAARLELARLMAREGDRAEALRLLRAALDEKPGMIRAAGMEVALLRASGRQAEAQERLAAALAQDPANSFLRVESRDPAVWPHLAADPQRVLDAAADYMDVGLYSDAAALLARKYPAVDPYQTEPGATLPQDHPLVGYYLAYCREKMGSAGDQYAAASRLSTRYVFPNRPASLAVLRRALAVNDRDATARFLIGELLMNSGAVDEAIQHWQVARTANPDIPVLHRNLGAALFSVKHEPEAALEVYREGLKHDPENVQLYLGASQALGYLGLPATERVAVLNAYPKRSAMPQILASDLALSLAEAGQADKAEDILRKGFFAREEGGTDVQEIYVEVELMKARTLVRAGKGPEASAVLAALGNDTPERYLRSARFHYLAGEIASAHDAAAARSEWRQASQQQGVYAVLARRSLGDEGWRAAAESMLAREVAGVNRGLLLRALGKEDAARAEFRRVLQGPDRRLQHYQARAALAVRP